MKSNKIALEEHFNVPELAGVTATYYSPDVWEKFRPGLLDVEKHLLPEMDRSGVETSVLSLVSSGIQGIPDKQRAIDTARRANDYLAELVSRQPSRFQGFAAVPMQDPQAASEELVRCVNKLGFRGLCLSGFSEIDTPGSMFFHDLPQFWPFWATVERLDVPCYLHPRYPVEIRKEMAGCPWLQGSVWGFGVDTATFALRLMTSGLFDQCPRLTIILGHLGETLPNASWRLDHRIGEIPRGIPAKKKPSEYLRNNFYLTTSGNFSTQALLNAMLAVGADRILFSADYPFEKMTEAAEWFDHVDAISETDWLKIARGNAKALFKLGAATRTATVCQ